MSLHIFYRAKSFKTFTGNKDIKRSLKLLLKRKNPPSTFLITGGPGCGKTTLGRIIAKKLGCSKVDYIELNGANDRGIKPTRAVLEKLGYAPLDGKKKVILYDECFAKGTYISTPKGRETIEQIRQFDVVYNLNGTDIVNKVIKTKVPLNRVVRLEKSNSAPTFCSKDHKYYYTVFDGTGYWIEANNLTDIDLLCYDSNMMLNTLLQKDNQDEVQILSEKVYPKKEKLPILLQNLRRKIQSQNKQPIKNKKGHETEKLRTLWFTFYTIIEGGSILFSKLCRKMEKFPTTYSQKDVHQRKKRKNIRSSQKICKDQKREERCSKVFRTNEEQQSSVYARGSRENKNNETSKWDIKYLERETWWKWTINRASKVVSSCFRLENGSSSKNSRPSSNWQEEKMVQNQKAGILLQTGHWKQKIKDWYRNRRRWTQLNPKTKRRQKKNEILKKERVESVTLYEQGCNDNLFRSIIGDKERSQGYVEFYDLSIEKNHSYIANNSMVHNCHQLTKDAQEALLKATEKPPEHIHFIFCTTNPEALKPTLKRRCHNYEVSLLADQELQDLLHKILKKEKIKKYPQKVLDKISELSDGSAGVALKYLDMVIDFKKAKPALAILKIAGTSETEIITLCKPLLNSDMPYKAKEIRLRKLLKAFRSDPESARRSILGYLHAVWLNSGRTDIPFMMDCFSTNLYDSGKAGLSLAFIKAMEDE